MTTKWKIFLIVACINLFYGKLAVDHLLTLKWNHSFSHSFSLVFYAIFFIFFSFIQTFFFSKKTNLFLIVILLILIAYLIGAFSWEIAIPVAMSDSSLNKFNGNYTSSPYSGFYYVIWGTFVGSFLTTFHAFWGALSALTYVLFTQVINLIKKISSTKK